MLRPAAIQSTLRWSRIRLLNDELVTSMARWSATAMKLGVQNHVYPMEKLLRWCSRRMEVSRTVGGGLYFELLIIWLVTLHSVGFVSAYLTEAPADSSRLVASKWLSPCRKLILAPQ